MMQINRNQRCVSLNVEPENIPLNLSKKWFGNKSKTKEIDKNLESMVIFLSKNLQEYKIRKN